MKVTAPTAMMATPSSEHSTTEALPTPTPLQGLAFGCFWAFNLVNSSRILELKFAGLHIPLVLGAAAAVFAVLGGGLGRIFRSTIGILMIALTVLYAANVPFSFWRAGQPEYVYGNVAKIGACVPDRGVGGNHSPPLPLGAVFHRDGRGSGDRRNRRARHGP